jgi:hypothetical protein
MDVRDSPILLSVLMMSNLQCVSIDAALLEPRMNCDAVKVDVFLLHLCHHLRDFPAAQTFNCCWHFLAMTAFAPEFVKDY